MSESLLRVGFFLDGYTLKKVNEYYRVHHRFHANLDFRGLKSWVQLQINRYFNKSRRVVELESHYYHPQRNPHIYSSSANGVFKLEFELRNAGYQVHYSDRLEDDGHLGPNLSLIEDALMFAVYCKMEAVVLLSTQGQYAPLADKLRIMGIPVLLLGWSFEYPKEERSIHWKTDTCLRDNCAHYVAMEKVIDRDPKVDVPPVGFFVRPEAKTKACSLAWSASRCGKSR
ncbi:MAG: NYN domain-containing protein [Fibrobacter sp.]|nr:NYN domain-containing protein [Fibrobacter sp.]